MQLETQLTNDMLIYMLRNAVIDWQDECNLYFSYFWFCSALFWNLKMAGILNKAKPCCGVLNHLNGHPTTKQKQVCLLLQTLFLSTLEPKLILRYPFLRSFSCQLRAIIFQIPLIDLNKWSEKLEAILRLIWKRILIFVLSVFSRPGFSPAQTNNRERYQRIR